MSKQLMLSVVQFCVKTRTGCMEPKGCDFEGGTTNEYLRESDNMPRAAATREEIARQGKRRRSSKEQSGGADHEISEYEDNSGLICEFPALFQCGHGNLPEKLYGANKESERTRTF